MDLTFFWQALDFVERWYFVSTNRSSIDSHLNWGLGPGPAGLVFYGFRRGEGSWMLQKAELPALLLLLTAV